MPIYEHECNKCKFGWLEEYSLEEFDRLKAADINLACPECESELHKGATECPSCSGSDHWGD